LHKAEQGKRVTKGRAVLALASAVAVVATGVVAVTAALAAPPTPTPTILSGPNAPTTSRTALFSYKDTQASANFKCSLDAGFFFSCPSGGIGYSALSEGPHTFRVEAQALTMSMSAPASRTWSVDTTAPTVAVSFPAAGRAYNAAGWNGSCLPSPGLCGSASDATGVASVQVALLQQSSGKYWSGSGFTLASQVFQTSNGTTSWRYPVALSNLTDGSYTVSVRATDSLGNATAPEAPLKAPDRPEGRALTAGFLIDTIAPPAPVITGAPDNATFQTQAEFHFTDPEQGATFRCQLDGGASPCSGGGAEYENLAVGDHCFNVAAVDGAGNVSAPASLCWTIAIKNTFGISGNASALFYPGATPQPLDLVLTNPFNFDIRVTAITVTVQAATTKNGNPNPSCNGTQNLNVARPFNGTVTLAKNATKSFSQLGTPASQYPLVQMPDLPVNQDACQKSTFNMSYSGTAVKS
jgi:hypothetical protein